MPVTNKTRLPRTCPFRKGCSTPRLRVQGLCSNSDNLAMFTAIRRALSNLAAPKSADALFIRAAAFANFLVVVLASPKPPINPSRSQTAGDALCPFPFDVLEPCYSPSSCSVVEDNWTPREPAMPVRDCRWASRCHLLKQRPRRDRCSFFRNSNLNWIMCAVQRASVLKQVQNHLAAAGSQMGPQPGVTRPGPAHQARRFDSGEHPVAISSKLAATCGS